MNTQISLFEEVNNLPEFTISYKTKGKITERRIIKSSKDAADLCRLCFDADTIEWVESFIVLGFARNNALLGFYKISQGGITGTVVDPRVILQFALLSNSVNLVICHNHPSGQVKPSHADEMLTNKIKQAAELMDIKILDHIILGAEDAFYSFADEGLL